jgi:oligopeptidase A
MNQLLNESILNNEINFQKLEAKHFIIAFEKLIPQIYKEFEQELLLDLNYENLFEKSPKNKRLSKILSYLNHLNGVIQNEELKDIFGKYVPQIDSIYQEIFLDKRKYNRIIQYKNTKEYFMLSDIRKKIINDVILNFQLNGINLQEKKKQRLKEISYRLTELSNKFENNIINVRKTFKKLISLEELKGLPLRSLNNFYKQKDGKYLVTEISGLYSDILKYCEIEKTRKIIYEEQLILGIKKGFDNRPILKEILNLRQEKAKILGYENYASYSLTKQMFKKPKEVLEFLENLILKALPQAIEENIKINKFGEQLLGKKIEFHDRDFVIQKMKEQMYFLDNEEIRKYFPISKVLSGLFEIIENLYSISFQKNLEKPKWHNDIIIYDILNDKKEKIGLLYLDLYKRENKQSGAWMLPQQSNVETEFKIQKPITYIVLNITKNQKEESTIEFEEIINLFHEMGHGLHNILSEIKEEYFSGLSNVENDAIELPSQFLENFVWDYEVLKKLSSHVITKEILPKELFDRIKNYKLFLAANQIVRQSILSYLDMYIHTKEVNPMEVEKEIFNRWKIGEVDIRNNFLPTFSHIFSGKYAAGYYSYIWSKVLSADTFHALKESGSTYLEQKEMANKFRKTILSRGGIKNMIDNFIEFRGRKPEIKFLLEDNGISFK